MMWYVNRLFNRLFDVLLWPCEVASPWPAMILASLVRAVVLVALFSVSSNQSAVRRTRNRFVARSLELLLFQHDLRVCITACGRILTANFAYLRQFLLPMAVGIIPLILLFVQMECWFNRRPLLVGERAVLTVELDAAHSVLKTPAELTVSETLKVDSTAVRIPSKNELAWRIAAVDSGAGWVEVALAGVTERKSLVTGDAVVRVSPRRESRGLIRELFSPSEQPLDDDSAIRRIQVSFPRRDLDEVLRSQERMLYRRKQTSGPNADEMKAHFTRHLQSVDHWLLQQPHIQVLNCVLCGADPRCPGCVEDDSGVSGV